MTLSPLGKGAIHSIQGNASVTIHGDGKITNGSSGGDALVSLSQVSGSLNLEDGASLAVNPGKTNPFQSFADPNSGNAVRVLSGSSLDLSRAVFANVATGSLTGAYEIGENSTITYSGPDINAIDRTGSLTLDGTSEPGSTGHFVNTASQANANGLEGTLSTVNGQLTLNGAIFTSKAASFRGDTPANGNSPAVTGNIDVLNGSTLDLSGTNWRDVSSGVLRSGNFLVADSLIKYSGDDITQIGAAANLTLDSGGGVVNVGNQHELRNTLTDVEGSLTLQNGTDFVSAASSFEVGSAPGSSGRVSVQNSSLLDLSNTSWGNLTGSTLDRGAFEIGDASLLRYRGDDIAVIGSSGHLTLDGSGEVENVNNPGSGGLQASLADIGGSFTLNGGAVFTSSASSFRTESNPNNVGSVSVLNGSTLDLSSTHWSNESNGALTNGHFEIGADSVLKYSGNDISTIGASAALVLDGNGKLTNINSKNPDAVSRTLTAVNGDLTLDQGAHLSLTGKTGLTVGSGAAVTVENGSTLELPVSAMSNAGSVTVGNGATLKAAKFTQTAGHTSIESGGALQAGELDLEGGELSGGGTIYGNLVLDGGALAPGDPQSLDVVGNYQQTLMAVLDLDFAGAGADEYDSIHVHSDATHAGDVGLGGTLDLTLEAGFGSGIEVGTLFHIFTWDGLRTGDFDIFSNRIFSNGQQALTFQEIFGDHGLDLEVIAASVTAPEPSTFSMLFGAILLAGCLIVISRRRKARN